MDCNSFLDFVSYEHVTGSFYWIADSPTGRHKKGSIAGYEQRGYLTLQINKKRILLHRLAWFVVYGELPSGIIDHINRDITDNRIGNLRDVTRMENGMNRKVASNNTSGVTGVCWIKSSKKWVAQISNNKKRVLIGCFDDKESAIAARKEKEIEYGYL